jgi:hypothetical protein
VAFVSGAAEYEDITLEVGTRRGPHTTVAFQGRPLNRAAGLPSRPLSGQHAYASPEERGAEERHQLWESFVPEWKLDQSDTGKIVVWHRWGPAAADVSHFDSLDAAEADHVQMIPRDVLAEARGALKRLPS